MVRIGLAGIGFMGMIHFLAARRLGAAGRVTAIASRDPAKRAGDWRGIRGNFGPEGTQMDLAGVRAHATLDDLLADDNVDLVDLCLPSNQHAEAAIRALQAGKHVLVEKPIALDRRDAEAMVAASTKTGRMLMVAHVLPFFPEFAFARDFVRTGAGGPLLAAHFKRVIAKPDWTAGRDDAATHGSPVLDLHIHDIHFIGLVCGVPTAVRATGVTDSHGVVQHVQTDYRYPSGKQPACVTCTSGAICMKGRPFQHGFELYFERATLVYESGTLPLTLLDEGGGSQTVALPGGGDPVDAFAAELAAAVGGVASGTVPETLSAALARDALSLCLEEEEAVRTGREVALA